MGSLFNGVCYPDVTTAQAAFCSTYRATYNNTTTVYELRCGAPGATWFDIYTYKNGVKQNGFTTGTYPTFQTCDYAGTSSISVEYMLAALGVVVVVYGAKKLLQLFETHHDRD